ncbi:MAG TPA: PilN domain-containing protein [Terriglobales bacterium]|jgi:type IV pilus assembly protein PilN|nr:PilN domain-containing protein [Terriglobales bacterium]
MRIAINLASRPYQDERAFYRNWGSALAMAIVVTALMVFVSVRHYVNTQREWAQVRETEAKLAELKSEEAQARQILAQPENRGTRDRSNFLNAAIIRKSFSWTRLMEDMEKVMPSGLRVAAITPGVDRNHFVLKLQVQGERREAAVELLRNMEKSSHFRSPQLSTETHTPESKNGEGAVKSNIFTAYLPAEPLEGGK